MFRVITIIFLLIINSATMKTAFAGIYIEEKITTTMPGKEFLGIKKTYISNHKALIIDPTIQAKQIYDFAGEKVYLVNDIKKTLSTVNLTEFKAPYNEKIYTDFASLSDQDFYCKESGDKKMIGKYNCSELVVYIPRIAAFTRLWLTSEIEPEFEDYFTFAKNSQDILQRKIMSMRKEKNIYVIESKTLVVRPDEPEKYLKTNLVKICSEEIPDELFALPVDYTVIR